LNTENGKNKTDTKKFLTPAAIQGSRNKTIVHFGKESKDSAIYTTNLPFPKNVHKKIKGLGWEVVNIEDVSPGNLDDCDLVPFRSTSWNTAKICVHKKFEDKWCLLQSVVVDYG
jgi:hypothetical protein